MLQHCKQWGQANGFSYFFSVDIDEYLMPIESGITLMDAFHDHVTNSGRSIFTDIPKLNFQVLLFYVYIHVFDHVSYHFL